MTLETTTVVRELPALVERYRAQLTAMDRGLALAGAALQRWAEDPVATNEAIAAAMASTSRPYATSLDEPVTLARPAPPFTPMTVVSADGSSIEPDRFAPVPCFVINIGAVVLPYGVGGAPVIAAQSMVGPTRNDDENEGEDAGEDAVAYGWGVNLLRDARELGAGALHAVERTHHGAVTLLLDGTLFPWDLDSRQVSERARKEAQVRTQEALDDLAAAGPSLSVGAYVSGSRSSEVVTSLRAIPSTGPLPPWPASDGQLFARILADGDRGAVFRARSERSQRVEAMFERSHEVCFFYVRVGGDLARVELPHWATTPAQVDRLHAAIIDQCGRCDGYPRVLQEAHEAAVISGADRLQFSLLLENEAARQGVRSASSGKHQSKRRRAV